MCTIVLAWQVFADVPVALAANRDELLDRSSEPPKRRDWGATVIAPKDSKANGTWLGYNEHGLLVTITNRWDGRKVDGARSRGLLVRDALTHESAEAAVRFVERELDARTYEGFHLLAADSSAALLVEFDGMRRIETLDPGIYVVVNVGVNGRYAFPEGRETVGEQQVENAERIRETLQPEPGEQSNSWLKRAREVLGNHEFGVCIHGDGFGTCSSSLISLAPGDVSFEFADGPPCETEYERVRASL